MGFEEVAKSHQGGGIGYAGAAQINAHEVAQCSRVIDRVFHCFIGQTVPLLHEVHAQHALEPHRWTPAFAALGVIGLNHLHQPAPGNHLFHLLQEHFAPGTLFFLIVFGLGNGLIHKDLIF